MAALCLILIIFPGILFQNRLNANVIRSEILSPEELEELRYELNDNTFLKEKASAGCKCERGSCIIKNEKETCQCPPEFGHYTPSLCKECECGKGANCTFESKGWWATKKICVCPEGYREEDGKCTVAPCDTKPCKNSGTCVTTTDGFKCICVQPYAGEVCDTETEVNLQSKNTDSSIQPTTTSLTTHASSSPTTDSYARTTKTSFPVFSTTRECDCGKYSKGCRLSWLGKMCDCLDGYIQKSGACAECYCGTHARGCTFSGNGKKCICQNGYSEKNGICTNCDCGENSSTCSFYPNGTKKCDCHEFYAQANGTCLVTCFGPDDCSNGTVCTRGGGGRYFCECPPNFRGEMCQISILCEKLESACQAMGAVCVLKNSNAYCACPRGKKINFKLGVCEDICNPDKCVHGKCKVIGIDYTCRCEEGYTGLRCEEKMKFITNNPVLWLIILVSVCIFICVLLFAIVCLQCKRK